MVATGGTGTVRQEPNETRVTRIPCAVTSSKILSSIHSIRITVKKMVALFVVPIVLVSPFPTLRLLKGLG